MGFLKSALKYLYGIGDEFYPRQRNEDREIVTEQRYLKAFLFYSKALQACDIALRSSITIADAATFALAWLSGEPAYMAGIAPLEGLRFFYSRYSDLQKEKDAKCRKSWKETIKAMDAKETEGEVWKMP
jgi:hypothetical protein